LSFQWFRDAWDILACDSAREFNTLFLFKKAEFFIEAVNVNVPAFPF